MSAGGFWSAAGRLSGRAARVVPAPAVTAPALPLAWAVLLNVLIRQVEATAGRFVSTAMAPAWPIGWVPLGAGAILWITGMTRLGSGDPAPSGQTGRSGHSPIVA